VSRPQAAEEGTALWTPSRIRLGLEVVSFATGCALVVHSAIVSGDITRLPFYLLMMGIPVSNAIDRVRRNGNGKET
jgi:hypothetical protein